MPFAGVKIIRGERVLLSSAQREDFGKIIEWLRNKEITHLNGGFLGNYLPGNEFRESEWFEKTLRSNEHAAFMILVPENLHVIGRAGIFNINGRDRNADLAAEIVEKEFLGKGLGTEVFELLTDYAFKQLNLFRLNSSVISSFQPSQKILKRLGFEEEGIRRQVHFIEGRYHDEIIYGLLRSDWEMKKRK